MANYFVNPTLLRAVRVARVGNVLHLVKGFHLIETTQLLTVFNLSFYKGAKGIRTVLFCIDCFTLCFI